MIYYKPEGYYRSCKNLYNITKKHGFNFFYIDVCEWLSKQALYRIYAPRPGYIPRPSYNNVGRPNLIEKTAKHVAKAFKKVYSNSNIPLVWPSTLQVDRGGEFMGECKRLMIKHNVKIQVVYSKRTQGVSKAWVTDNTDILIAMNNEKMRLLGMKPADAIKLRKTPKANESLPANRPIGDLDSDIWVPKRSFV
ncbi:13272_t:CDS:2 [Entrophospora sp. SA101]|nr:13272_t:CDS:2 [Entrophospora sp. SA101]